MLFRKDRKIKNLKQMIKNREGVIDKNLQTIKEQELLIFNLREIINSLEEENKELREQAFENAKPKRKPKTKKN